MSGTVLRLGTRGSELALWQARWARDTLLARHPGLRVEIVEVKSQGDIDLTTELSRMGSIGIFTQTLERQLLAGEVDVAVHSLKDVPAQLLSDELEIVAYSPREDPRDAWFHRDGQGLDAVAAGAVVATGSLRRRCQLLRRRPDLRIVPLRGNVNTRWRKFEEGRFEAMVLAAAGVLRLGWQDRITSMVDPEVLLPAVGQGIVGLECRAGSRAAELAQAIDDAASSTCARAERALLEAVAGGCVVPLAGHCRFLGNGQLELRARLGRPDGKDVLEARATGASQDPEAVGREAAEQLLRQGGETIVRETKALASQRPANE